VETSLRVFRVLEKPEMHEKGTSNMSTRTSTTPTLLLKEDALLKLKLIGYWVTTILVTFELLAGGVADLIHGPALLFAGDPVVLALAQLGYPVYLLTILGVWKLLGAVALLVPWFPRLKEWAYAGTFFVYAGAAASLAARGDGMGDVIAPLALAVLTLASWALRPPSRTLGVFLPERRTGVGPS
jgi:uncharacterized membrane protein YphA (DoxX/SURF4 family)